jgi:hypothetical protein
MAGGPGVRRGAVGSGGGGVAAYAGAWLGSPACGSVVRIGGCDVVAYARAWLGSECCEGKMSDVLIHRAGVLGRASLPCPRYPRSHSSTPFCAISWFLTAEALSPLALSTAAFMLPRMASPVPWTMPTPLRMESPSVMLIVFEVVLYT